jgi:hypothetical protein
MVALLHQQITDALAGTVGAYPLVPLNIAVMFVAHFFLPRWKHKRPRRISGQQFAVDDVGDFHLAIRFEDSYVLVCGATAVRVVHRVARNRLAIGCAEVVISPTNLPLLS